MTYESKQALEKIVDICEGSENLTMRQIRIFDAALEGLGYVMSQRSKMVEKWKQQYFDRLQAKRDRKIARQEEV